MGQTAREMGVNSMHLSTMCDPVVCNWRSGGGAGRENCALNMIELLELLQPPIDPPNIEPGSTPVAYPQKRLKQQNKGLNSVSYKLYYVNYKIGVNSNWPAPC